MRSLCCGFRPASGLHCTPIHSSSSSTLSRPLSQTSRSAARHAAHHHQQQSHRFLLLPAQAAAVDTQVEEDFTSPDNFYGILGVPQNASQRDIKRAYKAMMKDFHPDLSGDEESTEFCILLNDIYEVCSVGQHRLASTGWHLARSRALYAQCRGAAASPTTRAYSSCSSCCCRSHAVVNMPPFCLHADPDGSGAPGDIRRAGRVQRKQHKPLCRHVAASRPGLCG